MISQNAVTGQANIQGYLQNGEYQTETESASTGTFLSVPLTKVLAHDQVTANSVPTAFIRNGAREGRQFNIRSAGPAMRTSHPDPADAFAYVNVPIRFHALEVR